MTLADVAWFHENVDVWPLGAGFQTFKGFVDGMVMANDPAGSHIHQIQQCIDISQEESQRQNGLLTVSAAMKAHGSRATRYE